MFGKSNSKKLENTEIVTASILVYLVRPPEFRYYLTKFWDKFNFQVNTITLDYLTKSYSKFCVIMVFLKLVLNN